MICKCGHTKESHEIFDYKGCWDCKTQNFAHYFKADNLRYLESLNDSSR